MNKLSLIRALGLTAVAALCFAAPAAHAITFNFTSDHVTGGTGQGAGPFGSVTLTQNGTSVDFSVSLLNGNGFVRTGAGDFFYFKFNATGVAVGDITIDNAGFTAGTGALSGNGTGLFGFGIVDPNKGNGAGPGVPFFGVINFHVANSAIADFTTPNALGYIFAADIVSGTNGNTGVVAATGPTTPGTGVPDGGSTVALLGLALGALALIRRKITS